MEYKEKKPIWKRLFALFAELLFAAGTLIPIACAVYSVLSMEQYCRVYQDPIRVIATVVAHEAYDDEGDTDFHSYVSYTARGQNYAHEYYESKDTQKELTPVGAQVELEVSPEDPSKQLSNLRENGDMFYFVLPMAAGLLAVWWHAFMNGRRSKNLSHTPDTETIQKDAKLTVYGRASLLFWLLLSVGLGFYALRYRQMIWNGTAFIAVAAAVMWVWCLCVAIKDIGTVNAQEYELHYDTLVEKEILSGDDSDTYVLYYRSGETKWKTHTSKRHYEKSNTGDTVLSVYLPGRKKPVMHYDTAGDAC